MSDILTPRDEADLREIIAQSCESQSSVEILGSGSKRGLGRPVSAKSQVRLDKLSGIISYEPAELVMTARAGTPMREIQAALDQAGQHLAFEPPDLDAFFGTNGGATLGGVVACNLAGPRRIAAGAARDHVLGAHAVSGRGEIFKSGGQVVKNVTGFDLPKLLSGSYGTLAAMTEITVKALPRPQKQRTILVYGVDCKDALRAMTLALQSSHDVTGAAWLPQGLAQRSKVAQLAECGQSAAAIRVEGVGPSVVHRCADLRDALRFLGPTEELHTHNSIACWSEIRDLRFFAPDEGEAEDEAGDGGAVWRILLPPAAADHFQREIGTIAQKPEMLVDRGGGLIWLRSSEPAARLHQSLRRITNSLGGQASLFRADAQSRQSLPVFHPQPEPLMRLTQQVKEAFDPRRILNPGRLHQAL